MFICRKASDRHNSHLKSDCGEPEFLSVEYSLIQILMNSNGCKLLRKRHYKNCTFVRGGVSNTIIHI